jgi:hypothetical protein
LRAAAGSTEEHRLEPTRLDSELGGQNGARADDRPSGVHGRKDQRPPQDAARPRRQSARVRESRRQGIATTLGGLFRSDTEHRTAVWALAGTSASRDLAGDGVRSTMGIRPAWIRTRIPRSCSSCAERQLSARRRGEDRGAKTVATAQDPIVEELVPTELNRWTRALPRADERDARPRRVRARAAADRESRAPAQELRRASLGSSGGTSQVLYLTWDFCVAAP